MLGLQYCGFLQSRSNLAVTRLSRYPLCTCISIKFLEAELLVKRCVHLSLWDMVKLTSRDLTPIYILYISIPLEKGLATHSSVLAWRIPWIEECVCVYMYIYTYIQILATLHSTQDQHEGS